jgi:hypothetical protein
MDDTKSIFASKTFWGGAIAVGAGIAGLLGYAVSADDQAKLVQLIDDAAVIAGGLVAIWGRITATKRIG